MVVYGEASQFIPVCPNNGRLDRYHAFLSRYLPRDRAMYDQHIQTGMELLASYQGECLSDQLGVAIDALSTIVMGRSQKKSTTIVTGMELYGRALAGLRCNPITKTNWLGAIMMSVVLQVYEVCLSASYFACLLACLLMLYFRL